MRFGLGISIGAHALFAIIAIVGLPGDEEERDLSRVTTVSIETAPGPVAQEPTAPEVAPEIQEFALDTIGAPTFDPNAPPPPQDDFAPTETVQDNVEDPSEQDAEADLTAVTTRVIEPDVVVEVNDLEEAESEPAAPALSLPGGGADAFSQTPRGATLGAPAAPNSPRISSRPAPPSPPKPPKPEAAPETTPDETATETPVETAEETPTEAENRPTAEADSGADDGFPLKKASSPRVRPRNFEQQLAEAKAQADAERQAEVDREAERQAELEAEKRRKEEEELERQAADIAAALAAAIEDTPASTTAETSTAATAPNAGPPLTPGEIDGLKVQVGQCWRVPDGVENAEDLRVVLAIDLDPDGRVVGEPRLIEPANADRPEIRAAFETARRAILRCGGAGFTLPREKYEQWKTLELEFVPEGVLARW